MPAWPEPLRGTAGGVRGRRAVCIHGEKKNLIFFLKIYAIDKWIDSEWDSLWNTTGILLCFYTCIYTPPYSRDWEMCVTTLLLSWVLQKVQNSPQGWRKAPAVVNRCGDTNHVIGSARAVGGNLFFALWEANPFHLRAITFTHTH